MLIAFFRKYIEGNPVVTSIRTTEEPGGRGNIYLCTLEDGSEEYFSINR